MFFAVDGFRPAATSSSVGDGSTARLYPLTAPFVFSLAASIAGNLRCRCRETRPVDKPAMSDVSGCMTRWVLQSAAPLAVAGDTTGMAGSMLLTCLLRAESIPGTLASRPPQAYLSRLVTTEVGRRSADRVAEEVPMTGYRRYQPVIYRRMARFVPPGPDRRSLETLLAFALSAGIFLHPGLVAVRLESRYRTFRFLMHDTVGEVGRLTPLVAVPEALTLGYLDPSSGDARAEMRRGTVMAAQQEATVGAAAGKPSTEVEEEGDVCNFFFDSLSLLVNDILVALNNRHSDPRYPFANSLHMSRTLPNAPYLTDVDTLVPEPSASGPTTSSDGPTPEPSVADVLLRMVHNYVDGGPLSGKVEKHELQWAVSTALSHATPLTVRGLPGIGIVPIVHLFPHGEDRLNAVIVVADAAPSASSAPHRDAAPTEPPLTWESLRRWAIRRRESDPLACAVFGDDPHAPDPGPPRQLLVVSSSAIPTRMGEGRRASPPQRDCEVHMHCMAPVLTKGGSRHPPSRGCVALVAQEEDRETQEMWVLTSGSPPPAQSLSTAVAHEAARSIRNELASAAVRLGPSPLCDRQVKQ